MPDPDTFDQMRRALGNCSFPPGTAVKRFARQVSAMPREKVTDRQKRYVIGLAWKYRRQMPPHLVPSKDAVEAMEAARKAETKADATKAKQQAKRDAKSGTVAGTPPLLVMMIRGES